MACRNQGYQDSGKNFSSIRPCSAWHFGDHKSVGDNLFELRFFFGPGYRVYYTLKGTTIVLLLCGGDKATQSKDIAKAQNILNTLER